jgi:hypothetical protein
VISATGVLLVVELRSQNSDLHSALQENSAFQQTCCINTRVGALVVSIATTSTSRLTLSQYQYKFCCCRVYFDTLAPVSNYNNHMLTVTTLLKRAVPHCVYLYIYTTTHTSP